MLVIERAESKDLSSILEIENRSFPQPFSRNLFETELLIEVAHLCVARDSNKIVGYIDFWHVLDEIHLINIAVDPLLRRKGYGIGLMDFLIRYARKKEAREIYLDVRVSNTPAIELYKKYRFEKVSVRKSYYQDNHEDALVMKCVLLFAP